MTTFYFMLQLLRSATVCYTLNRARLQKCYPCGGLREVGPGQMKEAEMAKTPANYIDLDVVVRKEGSQYSSWCPDLDIASCGDSPDDALRNLGDAAELYLNTLEEEGELGKVFTERGIRIVRIDEPVVPRSFVTQYRQKVGASV